MEIIPFTYDTVSWSHLWPSMYSFISGKHEILDSVVSRTLALYPFYTGIVNSGVEVGGLVGHLVVGRLVQVGFMMVYIFCGSCIYMRKM